MCYFLLHFCFCDNAEPAIVLVVFEVFLLFNALLAFDATVFDVVLHLAI